MSPICCWCCRCRNRPNEAKPLSDSNRKTELGIGSSSSSSSSIQKEIDSLPKTSHTHSSPSSSGFNRLWKWFFLALLAYSLLSISIDCKSVASGAQIKLASKRANGARTRNEWMNEWNKMMMMMAAAQNDSNNNNNNTVSKWSKWGHKWEGEES